MTAPSRIALAHVGPSILAISGGRYLLIDDCTVSLPVHHGYKVEVTYVPATDTYTVRRVLVRGVKRWVKNAWDNVHAAELGEVAYHASLD